MKDLPIFLVKARAEIRKGEVALTTARMLCDELEHRQGQGRLLVQAYDLAVDLLEDLLVESERAAPAEAKPVVGALKTRVGRIRQQIAKIREGIG